MLIIEAKLNDFKDIKHFAFMNLCVGYLQSPLDPSWYGEYAIIDPLRTFVSTRVLHGLKRASAYFQSAIPVQVDKPKDAIKAWIDDFTIDEITEGELLQHIDDLFAIFNKHNLRLSANNAHVTPKKGNDVGASLDRNGCHLYPTNMEAINNMDTPLNAV